MTTIRRIVPVVCALAAGLALVATVSAGKGPAPGVQLEGRGVATVGGGVRYATRELAGSTRVTAFDADGRSLRQGTVTGTLGIPYVAYDGSLGGLAHDGRTLVLGQGEQARLSDVRMRVRSGSLVLRSRAGTHLATIDRSEFEVHEHVNPLRRAAGRQR